jgi:Uma2 family endonuclease
MRTTLRLPRPASYADYLAVQEHSDHRHELIDGVIVAMAGGSDEHNAIAGRFAMLLGNRLEGSCRYYTSDQRFWIAARGRSRYAAGSIVCGRPEHPPHDAQATTNPVVVVEVLSPSSVGDDAGDTREDFQSLPTLQAYLLVSQDRRCVRIHRRRDDGSWPNEGETHLDGATFFVPALNAAISVNEAYDNILASNGRTLLR